jgi:hypothetical protein
MTEQAEEEGWGLTELLVLAMEVTAMTMPLMDRILARVMWPLPPPMPA